MISQRLVIRTVSRSAYRTTRDLSMSTQRVVVTYSAPQSFLSSDQWIQLHDALSAQLPLRNIHWKPQTRPFIRTVQELEVQLVPLNTVRDESTSQVPYSLLEKPLLNIYVVTCEVRLHLVSSFDGLRLFEQDSDAYKTTVKKQIKDWQTSLSHRKNQEWVIVHVVRSDARNAATNFFQIKSNVLDKIRADFNTDKRERCVSTILLLQCCDSDYLEVHTACVAGSQGQSCRLGRATSQDQRRFAVRI